MDFNIRHAFIVGIALNRNCAEIIDEIYYKDENTYYNAYLTKGLRNDYLKQIFSMKVEDRINKLSGIIEATQPNHILIMEKIIRKAHPSIVNYVKKSTKIELEDFSMKYRIHRYPEDDQFSIGIAIMYLAYLYEKDFRGSSYIKFIIDKWSDYYDILRHNARYVKEYGEVDNSEYVLSLIDKGYNLLKLNKDEVIYKNIESILAELVEEITLEKLGIEDEDYMKHINNLPANVYQETRTSVFREGGIPGYVGSFSRYLKFLGIDSGDILTDIKIDNFDLETIFRDCSYSIKYDGMAESETEIYITACLFIYNLVQLYKECKHMYLNKSIQERHKEILELESKIEEKKEVFDLKIHKLKDEKKKIEDDKKALKQRLKELEKENARLSGLASKQSEKIEDLESNLKESNEIIENLKEECANLLESSITTDIEVSLDEKINYINQFKIGIFGGLNSIKTLSNKLTNISFYNSLNQDISSIDNLDAIFISYEFFNHSFTKKINAALKKYSVKRGYISGTNEELIINTIYNELLKFNI